ncbi:MAG: nitroreductase family protein [Actinomycetia bacterium]|nr:nitroreductase family protein [Actinomycetes bacterium]MCP3910157.1 nitroreductase family protein [Actinomycetes bacterium]MCP4087687.1 nitroreductase family protein [Actinomycetes bacterium]
MELRDAIRTRRMVRSFRVDSLTRPQIDDLLGSARRAPSAGNTSAVEFLVLTGDDVGRYWDTTLPEPRRASFRWPELLDAPVLVLVATRPEAYPDRYGEPDKERTGLGEGTEAWSVPYWWVDAGMVVQNLLLLAHDAGFGALFFGIFDHDPAVREAFGIESDVALVGTVAIGHPGSGQQPGRSQSRGRRLLDEVVHHGRW